MRDTPILDAAITDKPAADLRALVSAAWPSEAFVMPADPPAAAVEAARAALKFLTSAEELVIVGRYLTKPPAEVESLGGNVAELERSGLEKICKAIRRAVLPESPAEPRGARRPPEPYRDGFDGG